jgi:hypothetical protein
LRSSRIEHWGRRPSFSATSFEQTMPLPRAFITNGRIADVDSKGGELAMRLVCFSSVALCTLVVGFASTLAVDRASAQARTTTTTTFNCTTPSPPCGTTVTNTAIGANTGGIAANAVTSAVQTDIEEIRKRRTTDPDAQANLWGQSSFGGQNQSGQFNGSDIGSVSRTWDGIAGFDITRSLASGGSLTYGFLGGDSYTFASVPTGATSTTRSLTAGLYLVYANGNFSTDLNYSASWMSNGGKDVTTTSTFAFGDGTATSTSTSSARGTVQMSHDIDANVHYRFNLANDWWLEPTTGLSWVHNVEGAGLEDMNVVQIKAGTVAGTSFMWGRTRIEPTFTALAYSDVSVTGGTVKGGPPISTDQGQLWGKGVAKLNYVWSKNLSSAVSGELYGTSGTETSIGYKAGVELRYSW